VGNWRLIDGGWLRLQKRLLIARGESKLSTSSDTTISFTPRNNNRGFQACLPVRQGFMIETLIEDCAAPDFSVCGPEGLSRFDRAIQMIQTLK
jgi:hypothetical protein